MIQIFVNGQSLETIPNTSIRDLLRHLKIDQLGTAVALNQSVVPKSQWGEIELKEQDNLVTFHAVAGG
ncbi:sulfur carrier protein ThiS [Vibrio tritonius]|uniref:Sulfur carrier protein ThiS n=1 Tax=Vibrio tritonius TaxID=1435069 RepID=A0ABS7YH68_9VIBR|nr:sulfur carrier protein ThiS [Vibrio tritonius]MCA2015017.1 sulfur carrier protein ThiS [Vibrio tritonius]